MAELSKEQIEAAEEAYMRAFSGRKGCRGDALLAAAPHLQYPLEPVTDEEVRKLENLYSEDPYSIRRGVKAFVANRNAANAPKPSKRDDVARLFDLACGENPHISRVDFINHIEALYSEAQ